MRQIELPDPWFVDAVLLDSCTAEELHSLTTPLEREHAATMRLPARRDEWLLARAAARLRLRALGIADTDLLTRHDAPPELVVTFSHSRGRAAAAVSPQRVGIDLEVQRALAPRILRFFLSPSEARPFEEWGSRTWVHAWAAKEASFKAVASLELLSQVHFAEIEQHAAGITARFEGAGLRGAVRTAETSDIVVALARITGESP